MRKFVLFDLDETLYPRDAGLLREVGRRIQMWLCEHMGLTWEQAIVVRRDYFQRYGTTLGGLMAEHDVDAHGYLAFVHDVPVETYLAPNPALAAMLAALPLRRVVYTNATVEYGWRVLRALGVSDHFERVIGIETVGLRNKVCRDAYEHVLALLGAQGSECIMVEDAVRNLRPAKALGMATVLVGTDGSGRPLVTGERGGGGDTSVDFVVSDVLEVGQVVQRLLDDVPGASGR